MEMTLIRENICGLRVDTAEPRRARKTAHPLLFVHGAFSGGWYWAKMLRFMAKHGRAAYALTLRGRPDSLHVPDLGNVSIADFRSDIESVLDTLAHRHAKPFALVEHSLGGLLAQMVIERRELGAAVLVAPAPPSPLPLLPGRGLPTSLATTAGVAFAAFMGRPLAPDPEMVEWVVRGYGGDPTELPECGYFFVPESGRVGMETLFGRPRIDPRLARRTPILVIGAGNDAVMDPSTAFRVADHYGAMRVMFPGRSHMLMIEPEFEDVARAMDVWLRDLEK